VRPVLGGSTPPRAAAPVHPARGPNTGGLRLGSRVHHASFGEGVILHMEGQGAHTRVQINFAQAGTKWLVLAYASLEPL